MFSKDKLHYNQIKNNLNYPNFYWAFNEFFEWTKTLNFLFDPKLKYVYKL